MNVIFSCRLHEDRNTNSPDRKLKKFCKKSEEKCKFPVLDEIFDTIHEQNEICMNKPVQTINKTEQGNKQPKLGPQTVPIPCVPTSETECAEVKKRTKPDLSILDEIFS